MKKALVILLLAAALLWMSAGCASRKAGDPGRESAALTLVIRNETGIVFYELAVRYAADGEILGTMAAQRAGNRGTPDTGEYRFVFTDEALSGKAIDRFQVDVFAAPRAGEDHISCGSAVFRALKPGESLALILSGDEAGLFLSADGADPLPEFPAAP